MDWRGIVVLVMAVVLMEFLLWCFCVLNVRERRRKKSIKILFISNIVYKWTDVGVL